MIQHTKRLILFILFVLACSLVLAGPISEKDITFSFTVSDNIFEGSRLHFISIGEFNNDNWSFSDYYTKIKSDYSNYKVKCGASETFYEIIYEMSDVERQHKGCTINGTYQEVYCFKPTTDIDFCEPLAPHKINDDYILTFDTYYNSYVWDIGRANQYNHFKVSTCLIEGNICNITFRKDMQPYNPFVVILETKDDVYFSERINIQALELFYEEPLFDCKPVGCDIHQKATIHLDNFNTQAPNIFKIGFSDKYELTQENSTPEKDDVTFFQRILLWFKRLVN